MRVVDLDAGGGQDAREIAGAFLAGEVEHAHARMQMRLHHAGEIADVAVRRDDVGEALRQRGVGGAAADGIGRTLEQRLQRADDRRWRARR